MKIIYKIVLLVIAFMFCSNIDAQYYKERKLTGDFRFGFNSSDIDIKGGNVNKVPKFGANLSFLANYRFLGNLRLQSGVGLSKKGMKQVEKGTIEEPLQTFYYEDVKVITANYFTVPLNLGYEVYFNKEFAFNINGGGYVAIGFDGNNSRWTETYYKRITTDQSSSESTETRRNERVFERKNLKRLDYGVGANLGFVYDVYAITFGYEHGLNNIAVKKGQEMKNRNYYITLGFRF